LRHGLLDFQPGATLEVNQVGLHCRQMRGKGGCLKKEGSKRDPSMHEEDAKATELAFRERLPYLLPESQPIRFIRPLLAIISGYAIPTASRLLYVMETEGVVGALLVATVL
jgi:hypothetical protein